MMIAISFSRAGIALEYRTWAPTRCTRSHRSGLRSSALNGPRSPAPRGPAWMASATVFCSGVMVSGVSSLKRRSLIAFLLLLSRRCQNQAAVDDDLGSRNIIGLVGGQEKHSMRHIPRCAHPPHRRPRIAAGDERCRIVAADRARQTIFHQRRVHQTWHHGVAADALLHICP